MFAGFFNLFWLEYLFVLTAFPFRLQTMDSYLKIKYMNWEETFVKEDFASSKNLPGMIKFFF